MVSGPKKHDGTGHGGNCNAFYDGDVCIHVPQGGGCTAMSKDKAVKLAVELLTLVDSMDDSDQ